MIFYHPLSLDYQKNAKYDFIKKDQNIFYFGLSIFLNSTRQKQPEDSQQLRLQDYPRYGVSLTYAPTRHL